MKPLLSKSLLCLAVAVSGQLVLATPYTQNSETHAAAPAGSMKKGEDGTAVNKDPHAAARQADRNWAELK